MTKKSYAGKKYLEEFLREDGKRGSPRLHSGLKNYLIDIDGVICEDIPNEEPERMMGAKEIPGAVKQINEWYDKGNIITFFTSRTENLREITINWLKEHGFKYHNIIFNKPRGGSYHYIDDGQIGSTSSISKSNLEQKI
ncbi:phosphoheptose isomerase [Candidatus Pacearchaeota archaeon]|nr:phosphoheptose isomerase [Candidatus Pacearchaeota archaeon]